MKDIFNVVVLHETYFLDTYESVEYFFHWLTKLN